MRFLTITFSIAASVIVAVSAAPTPPSTISILNYALTLEHLESEFYKMGLAKFDENAFIEAGFDPKIRSRVVHIGEHENEHVKTLTSVIKSLKGDPVPKCSYNFPMDNVTQLLTVAQALENTGVSAYIGSSAGLSGDILTTAASIVSVEGRQASFLNELHGQIGAPYTFDTALSRQQVITIATTLITSCPYDLGIKPFNHLMASIDEKSSKVETSFTGKGAKSPNTYCQFLYGSKTAVVPRSSCVLPKDADGYVFVLITSSKTPVTMTSQSNILAGPALVFNGPHDH